jgi:hypothetical protein
MPRSYHVCVSESGFRDVRSIVGWSGDVQIQTYRAVGKHKKCCNCKEMATRQIYYFQYIGRLSIRRIAKFTCRKCLPIVFKRLA